MLIHACHHMWLSHECLEKFLYSYQISSYPSKMIFIRCRQIPVYQLFEQSPIKNSRPPYYNLYIANLLGPGVTDSVFFCHILFYSCIWQKYLLKIDLAIFTQGNYYIESYNSFGKSALWLSSYETNTHAVFLLIFRTRCGVTRSG